MKLLVASKLSDRHVERLSAVGEKHGVYLDIVCSEDKATIRHEIVDTEIFVTWWSTFDPEYVRCAKSLKWIQTLTAGVDNFLMPEIKEQHIILSCCKGIHGVPMSEHMLGMLLGVTRGLYQLRESQKDNQWERPRVEELFGKTLVILGMGHVGAELAKRAKVFGMRVIGVKRTPTPLEFADQVYGKDQLDEALALGDVVVSILPYTPDTYHLLSTDKFLRMKQDAIFMNFGRGDVVHEEALVETLKAGHLRAAILDVFEDEPLDAASPLWQIDNVYISPHMSALSNRYMERAMDIISENLEYYLTGQPMINLVDFAKGY